MVTLERLLSAQVVERIGWTLIHFVWQGTAVALLLAVVLKALHKHSAPVRYIIACTALGLVVVMPVVTLLFVEVSRPTAEAGLIPLPVVETLPIEVIEVSELPFEPIDAPLVEVAPPKARIPWTQRTVAALEPALPYLVLGWLLGVFGLSAWHLGGWAQLQRMRCHMVRDVAKPLEAKLAELAGQLGVTCAVGLLQSALVEVPTVVGWIKPVILLPASAISGLSSDQLEAILAHELAHVRRHDYLVNILQTVVEILGFYHPGPWWISRKIRDERENCCDDLAVQVTGDSVRYARALTSLEEMRHRGTELAIAAGGGNLLGRIARLLGRPAPRTSRFTWLPGLIALVLATLIVIPTALVLAAPGPIPLDAVMSEHVPEEPGAADLEAKEESTVRAKTETYQTAASEDEAEILIDLVLAEVRNDTLLERDTVRSLIDTLAEERPEVSDQIAVLESEQGVTLGRVLRTCVQGKPLTAATAEKLLALLESHGHLETQASPRILTRNNEQATIKIGTEVPIPLGRDLNSPPMYVDLGTSIQITPHLSPTGDLAVVEMGVTWNQLAKGQEPNRPPAVSTKEIATQVAVPNDRYFLLLMDADETEATRGHDERSMLVLFRAKWGEQRQRKEREPAEDDRQDVTRERLIQLSVRIVEVDRDRLDDLGLKLSGPDDKLIPELASGPGPNLARPSMTGTVVDTQALLAGLDELCRRDQAKVAGGPSMNVRNDEPTKLSLQNEEQYDLDPAKDTNDSAAFVTITSGIKITATPRIENNDDVILEIDAEISDVTPGDDPNGLPIVTRHTVQSTAKLQNGDTIVLAGATLKPDSQDEDSPRDTLILATVRVLSDDKALAPNATEPPSSVRATLPVSPDAPGRRTPAGSPARLPSSEDRDAVEIEARFLVLSYELAEALQRGTLIEDTNSPEEIAALATLEQRMTPNEWIDVDEAVVSTLLKVAQRDRGSRSLAAPRVNVLADESTAFSLIDDVSYTAGYDDADDTSSDPVAKSATVSPGLTTRITPSLGGDDQITLNGTTTFTNLKGFEDRTYRGEHVYQIPVLDRDEIVMKNVHMANGRTALLLTSSANLSCLTKEAGGTQETQLLLILIKATKTQINASNTAGAVPMSPALQPDAAGALPPGFGVFAPGTAPVMPKAAGHN